MQLRADSDAGQVILAGHLMAAPDIELLDAASLPEIEPFGLPCPPKSSSRPNSSAITSSRSRTAYLRIRSPVRGHVRGYNPQITTLTQQQRTKATELGVGLRTVERKRAATTPRGGCAAWSTSAPRASSTPPAASTRDWSRCCASDHS